ncbi:Ppx/GppA phosphatase family protein [Lichenibacterium dinghuense]|uniref:Ppx/GppA phosphatase family protein n=1 Tax=Lichenibacterium dinghuense TaxID=2895977 RepID=UPI001F35FF4A|nr:Ppx/GppA phosphatase family protein [Lichenibacterium sp. 6Y81]
MEHRAPSPTRATEPHEARRGGLYAALDLGTNNCRLLVARPSADGLQIVDSFSRIVRLGEGLSVTGRLGDAAIERTLAALAVCRDKIAARGVGRSRLIATEACRAAANGPAFIACVRDHVGLDVEVVDRGTEAALAAEGCAALADEAAEGVVLFDIGGGSSEIVWLDRDRSPGGDRPVRDRIRAWTSLPLGVVSMADRFGGVEVSADCFGKMVRHVEAALRPFAAEVRSAQRCHRFHLLGTSGTVTTVAGVFLDLPRYDRRRVDGLWMSRGDLDDAIRRVRAMPFAARVANGCIGPDRADLVIGGCAILEALRRTFPCERLRIADRGLREGILIQMMSRDGVWSGRPVRVS